MYVQNEFTRAWADAISFFEHTFDFHCRRPPLRCSVSRPASARDFSLEQPMRNRLAASNCIKKDIHRGSTLRCSASTVRVRVRVTPTPNPNP